MTALRIERASASMVGLLLMLLLDTAPASALDVEVKGVRTVGAAVTTAIELRDVIPDRFKKPLIEGGVLHLRVQAELWEARPVWDRLVYPVIVRVFRFTQGAGATLSMTDATGAVTTTQEAPRSMPVDVALGDPSRVNPAGRYYVHIVATLGTLAERERQAGRHPECDEAQPFAEHAGDDIARACAERDPDADLAAALRDDEREHAVEPDRGEADRDRPERRQQRDAEPPL